MSTDPSNQDDQNDEYGKQVLARYEARHRSFVKNYAILVVFAFAFLAFILVPMIAIKFDAESLPQELVAQEKALESLVPRHRELEAEDSKLQDELASGDSKLKQVEFLHEESRKEAAAAREEAERLGLRLTENAKEKRIAEIALGALRRSRESGKYPALEEAFKRADALYVQEKELSGRLETAQNASRERTAEEERLRAEAEPIRRKRKEVEASLRATREDLEEARKATKRGKEAIAQMEQRQIDIQDRLRRLETPFGALPLSLTEASLSFPLIVATGFLIYALVFADLLRLRREYHQVVSASRKIASDTIHHRIALVVPLWLDPLKSAWRNVGGASLIFMPALAYFVIVWLVSTDRLFDLEARRLDRHLIRFYGALYVAGAFFVALGVWRILAEWWGYRGMLAPETPHTKKSGRT